MGGGNFTDGRIVDAVACVVVDRFNTVGSLLVDIYQRSINGQQKAANERRACAVAVRLFHAQNTTFVECKSKVFNL